MKGPADRLLRGIGVEVSARGVAGFYADWMHGFVIDERDEKLRGDVEAHGLRCEVVDTLMRDVAISENLARTALDLAHRIGRVA